MSPGRQAGDRYKGTASASSWATVHCNQTLSILYGLIKIAQHVVGTSREEGRERELYCKEDNGKMKST